MDLKYACGKLFDILFPRKNRVGVFDAISPDILARIVCTTWVACEVSCIAPLPYANRLVRDAVHATKYHNHARAAHLLGATIAPVVAEVIAEKRLFGTYLTPLVIPVPLHPARLRERGFNQSARIAVAMIKEMSDKNIQLASDILIRTKNTPRQARQADKKTRLKNMSGAFAVKNPDGVAGFDCILLDDVCTTGATMHTAQQALLRAGAREVICVATAH